MNEVAQRGERLPSSLLRTVLLILLLTSSMAPAHLRISSSLVWLLNLAIPAFTGLAALTLWVLRASLTTFYLLPLALGFWLFAFDLQRLDWMRDMSVGLNVIASTMMVALLEAVLYRRRSLSERRNVTDR